MRKHVYWALCALVLLAGCNRDTKVVTNVGPTPVPSSPGPPAVTQVTINTLREAIGECSKTIDLVSDQPVNWTATGPSISFTGSNSNTPTATVVIKGNGSYTITATPVSDRFTARSMTISVSELKDCSPAPPPSPTPPPAPRDPQCRDRVDNDGDGKIDHPADPGCSSPDDDDERDPAPPPPPPPPPAPSGVTCTLDANPMSVSPGGAVTLKLTSTGATEAAKSWTSNIAPLSTDVVHPTVTTTYRVTCKGPGGTASDEKTVTVVTTPAPVAPTCSLTANPNPVAQGGNVRLTWTSTNTTTIVASGDWSGGKAVPSGFQDIIVAVNKTFTITCTGPGGTSTDTEVVFVTTPACPTSIDYSPKGGTRTVGSVFSLMVDNWPSGVSCVPFWYSGDPSRFGILGGDQIWTAPDGSRYFAGVNGQGKAIAVGSTSLSVQTSIAINSVSRSYTWTAVAAGLEALGIRMPDPPLPKYNIYTDPDVCQTYPCKKK